MKIEWRKIIGMMMPGLASTLLTIGCTGNSPVSPSSDFTGGFKGGNNSTTAAAQIEFGSHVASVDVSQRKLTFNNNSETVYAAADADIVRKDGGNETPIDFSEIVVGDSVEIRGNRQADNSILADRIRVKSEDNNNNEVEFGGRVATIDATARTITFVNNPTLIVVDATADITNHDLQIQIDLSEIVPGDSVEIRGANRPDGSVLADRVRLRTPGAGTADVEFKAFVASIDYTNNSFTVTGRSETILVDANTIIYASKSKSDAELGKRGHDEDDDNPSPGDTILSFSDLKAGDPVEVHADIVDASTLLALRVELEDRDGVLDDIQFKATIASIDVESRTVIFEGQTWLGTVSATAILTGFNNEPINLSDFTVGQLVEVKGFPGTSDALAIVRMHKEDTL